MKSEAEIKFLKLKKKIGEYYPKTLGTASLIRAWKFAKLAHYGQKRLSGEDYIFHPLAVAETLADWKLDSTTIQAGLLHDAIEDGGATREDIVNNFGESVALLVEGVSKVTSLRLRGSREENFVENLRNMLLVMARDLRVILIKLADRLHNMQTLDALDADRAIANARETLDIYAPLAERLGMGRVKSELDDLAFKYIFPSEYQKIFQESRLFYKKAEDEIEIMRRRLLAGLGNEGIRAAIHGRKKHLYSLWRKLERPEIDWDYEKIHDIVALRILVNKVADCYLALGVVHELYKPVPHIGISDFIAQPKPNGYRSIHTKVFGPSGRIVEVQIRTYEMHDQAENGVAAHWAYSLAKKNKISDLFLEKSGIVAAKEKLSWVKQLVDWQKEITDSAEYLKAVKFDALSHRNFVFSPKGDVFDLPSRATPVDFAFAVHSDLGRYIKGARVNGKIVPLNYILKSGDVVEIIKTKDPQVPSLKWLDFIVTTEAKKKIKKNT